MQYFPIFGPLCKYYVCLKKSLDVIYELTVMPTFEMYIFFVKLSTLLEFLEQSWWHPTWNCFFFCLEKQTPTFYTMVKNTRHKSSTFVKRKICLQLEHYTYSRFVLLFFTHLSHKKYSLENNKFFIYVRISYPMKLDIDRCPT